MGLALKGIGPYIGSSCRKSGKYNFGRIEMARCLEKAQPHSDFQKEERPGSIELQRCAFDIGDLEMRRTINWQLSNRLPVEIWIRIASVCLPETKFG